MSEFCASLKQITNTIHEMAREKGFWPEEELDEETLANRILQLWEDTGSKPIASKEALQEIITETIHLARESAPTNVGEKLALITSEVSEILEAYRHGDPSAEHIDGFRATEEEAADVLIRLIDFAHHQGIRLGEAVEAQIAYNAGRPYKHGKSV